MISIDPALPGGQSRMSWVWKSVSLRAAAACLLVYAACAILLAPAAFAAFIDHYFGAISYFMARLILPVCAIGCIAVINGVTWRDFASHLVGRLSVVAILLVALLIAFASYTTFKFKIPDIVPFYADSWAAGLDAWLHHGDAWRLAHAVWPDAWSRFVFYCYNYGWFLYWFGTPLFVVLWQRPEIVKRYLWALLLTFIVCGTILATLYSSVGPVFFADILKDDRYGELMTRLGTLDGMNYILGYADYLYTSYEQQNAVFGTGISAIPSMHVAVVTLNAWLFSAINRWAGLFAWVFAAMIMFGSVYTGWHYAIDGYMSFLAVTAVWFAVRRAHALKIDWSQFRPAGWQAERA